MGERWGDPVRESLERLAGAVEELAKTVGRMAEGCGMGNGECGMMPEGKAARRMRAAAELRGIRLERLEADPESVKRLVQEMDSLEPRKLEPCSFCEGHGEFKDIGTCGFCDGTGAQFAEPESGRGRPRSQEVSEACPECGGSGYDMGIDGDGRGGELQRIFNTVTDGGRIGVTSFVAGSKVRAWLKELAALEAWDSASADAREGRTLCGVRVWSAHLYAKHPDMDLLCVYHGRELAAEYALSEGTLVKRWA
jgi:hypothetical protein